MEARVQFAKMHIQHSEIWSHIILNDEKEFNVDDLDGQVLLA